MYYCSQCGNPLPDDSLFCAKCGARVPDAASATTSTEKNANAAAKNAEETVPVQPKPAEAVTETAPAEDAPVAAKLLFDGRKTPGAVQMKTLVVSGLSAAFCVLMDVFMGVSVSSGGLSSAEKLFMLVMIALTIISIVSLIPYGIAYSFQKTYIDVYTDHVEGLAAGSCSFAFSFGEITHFEKCKKYELRITANGRVYRVCARNEYNAAKVMELLKERTKQG